MSERQKISFKCDWCGGEGSQTKSNYSQYKVHFCKRSCASFYRHREAHKLNIERLQEKTLCACGCGTEINKYAIRQEGFTTLRKVKFVSGHTGRLPNSGRFPKGHQPANLGVPVPEEQKQRQKQKLIGRKRPIEELIKQTCTKRGISIEEFDGFVRDRDVRKNREETLLHKEWRIKVFQRDNYTCQHCGSKSGNGYKVTLNAHHILSWKEYPELRRELSNGITLCKTCHHEAHRKIKKVA